MTAAVSRRQALAWRLSRHLLAPVGDRPVAEVVRRLGAVLAMDGSLAALAVASRRDVPDLGGLSRALAAGELVTVFAFRGSTHHVTPEDAGAYLAIRCAGRQWELPSWREYYRLEPDQWPGFRAAVREVLADGPLSVHELGARLTRRQAYRHLGPVFDDGAGTLLKPLSWQGDLCLGPRRDGRLTVQRLDANPRWAGVWDLDDAGRYAVRQYLSTYGPADADLVHHWLGAGLSAGAKRLRGWLADLADQLVPVDVEGRAMSVLHEDLDSLLAARPTRVVRLLPGHDQWVMGPGTQETAVVPARHRTAVTRKANLVTVGGVVRGTWAVRGDQVVVTRPEDDELPGEGLAEEVARLSALLGRPLEPVVRTDESAAR